MRSEMESIWNAMKDSHYRRTLDRLENSIQDVRSLDEAIPAALETVFQAIHAQTGTFWFYDRFGDGRIHPHAAKGGDALKGIALMPGDGIAGQVIKNGQSVIIPDCQTDPHWAGKVDQKTGFQTRTMLCVPVKTEQAVVGCIQIINKTDGLAFDEKDLALAEHLADKTVRLLRRRGLLKDYTDADSRQEQSGRQSPSFRDVFLADTVRESESWLRSLPEFSALPYSRQQEVLRLMKELRGCFVGHSDRNLQRSKPAADAERV